MTERGPRRGFAARPGDPDAWVRTPELSISRISDADLTARLTIDVTPTLRGRIKITAFQRSLTVAEMLRTLLDRDDVDIVSVASPPSTRPQIITDAAAAGKHVVCEKPFALSLAAADKMIASFEAVPPRSLHGWNTAYPRVSKLGTDPENGLAVGYVMNRMSTGMTVDPRSRPLIRACYEAVGATPKYI